MGTTRTFRFRDYVIRSDALPTYAAECVTDREPNDEDAPECGAASGDLPTTAHVDKWIAGHVRDTGHGNFRRTAVEYASAHPGEWQ